MEPLLVKAVQELDRRRWRAALRKLALRKQKDAPWSRHYQSDAAMSSSTLRALEDGSLLSGSQDRERARKSWMEREAAVSPTRRRPPRSAPGSTPLSLSA